MGQQANITVFDGAATPVSHTLVGDGIEKTGSGQLQTTLALWREQIATVPDYAQVRLTQFLSRLKSGIKKTVSRVEVPVMESVSGQNAQGYTAPPKVAYVDRYELVGFHSPRSTETTKRIAMQILLNHLNNVATTVTPVSAGVAADVHQRLIQVS